MNEVTGHGHREDHARGRSGGPAGNARLTSWTGLLLLVLLAAEGVTLLSLGQLLDLHIIVGAFVVPLVLLKSASTGWRILRYYTRDDDYVRAGPPLLVLRVLGPLVILSTLTVFGTGLALIAMGADSFRTVVSAAGFTVTMVTLHQVSFVAWFLVMTLHVLARTVPAVRTILTSGSTAGVSGGSARLATLAVTLLSGVVVAVLIFSASSWWTTTWHHVRP